MIDYEVKIFNSVHEVAAPLCAKNKFVSTISESVTAFPTGALFELDNTLVRRKQSSTPTENFAAIVYQAECYAQTKPECRKLFQAIDTRMIQLNFTRTSGQYLPYPDNLKVVRYVARYEAMVDADGNLYRIQT